MGNSFKNQKFKRRKNFDSIINRLFHEYKVKSKKRKRLFLISLLTFKELIMSPCAYCGASNSNFRKGLKYNGIDRIDSSLGYVENNVLPCCRFCNRMKSDMILSKFIKQSRKISNHFKSSRLPRPTGSTALTSKYRLAHGLGELFL